MRTKAEIKKAISFFSGTDWPVYVSHSVAHGILLVDEVRRLRRELRKQIKGNQRLSRALGLIIEHKGPVLKMQGDPPEVTKEWNWVNTSPPNPNSCCRWSWRSNEKHWAPECCGLAYQYRHCVCPNCGNPTMI